MKAVQNRKFLWLLTILYIGIIYSTLSIMPKVRDLLSHRFGNSIYIPVYAILVLGFLFMIRYSMQKIRSEGIKSLILVGGMGLVYLWSVLRLENPVERVHYVEYGLLSILFYQLVSTYTNSIMICAWATLSVYWVGMIDELIQWILPSRVGEYRDIIFNGLAGLFVQIIIAFVIKPQQVRIPFTRKQLRNLFRFVSVTIVGTAVFMTLAHTYGHRISFDQISFFSHLSEAQLNHLNSLSTTALGKLETEDPETFKHYIREAGDHFNMTQFHCEQKKELEAAGEFQIAQRYFKSGMSYLHLNMNPICFRKVQFKMQSTRTFAYQGEYLKDLITAVSLTHIWVVAVLCIMLISFFSERTIMKWKADYSKN